MFTSRALCLAACVVSTLTAPLWAISVEDGVYRVARYGETGGFSLGSHADEFVVDYELGCWNGSTFNTNVHRYTAPEIDVIFIGGDNSFSTSTARAIENAVYNDGKVLMINFWAQRNFSASLPAYNQGNHNYGSYLTAEDPGSWVWDGLPTHYPRVKSNLNRENCTEKPGATVVLRYDDGDPALLYWKYGEGYVIEWTLECIRHFDFAREPVNELDELDYRLLKHVLPALPEDNPTIPEPATMLAGLAGLAGIGRYVRRRRKLTR